MSGGGLMAAVAAIVMVVAGDVWVGVLVAAFVLCVVICATIHSNRKERS